MAIECEAKIKVDGLAELAGRLRRLGAEDRGSEFERNWVLDRSDGSLYAADVLLRIRSVGGAGGVLTVKCPTTGGAFKSREEIECRVDSTDALLRQLSVLGFRPAWLYEKRRATWLWRGCAIALDELPELGFFVEVEGDPDAIPAVCRDLGLDPDDHLNENYLGLWKEYLRKRGESDRDMVFKPNYGGHEI